MTGNQLKHLPALLRLFKVARYVSGHIKQRFRPSQHPKPGEGWSPNRLVVVVDPLQPGPGVAAPHFPSEYSPEGAAWLDAARDAVGKVGCEACGAARYFYGTTNYLVTLRRFQTEQAAGECWVKDKPAKDAEPLLARAGVEERFTQAAAAPDKLAFRRRRFVAEVEGAHGLWLAN